MAKNFIWNNISLIDIIEIWAFFCSRECLNKYKKTWFKGENNHQFGLKGPLNFSFKGEEISNKNNKLIDVKVYAPEFYSSNKSNRINKHIYLILKK